MPSSSNQKTRPLVNRLVSATAHPLTPIQKWTLVALLDHQNNRNGTKVWPSVVRISAISGYCEKTTRVALHNLRDMGFLTIDAVPGATSLYYLNLEKIEKQSGRTYQTNTDTPVGDTGVPRYEIPDRPVGDTAGSGRRYRLTGNEPVNEPVNLTGSDSNRQKSEGLRPLRNILERMK